MEELLAKPYKRRIFLAVAFMVIALLAGSRFLLVPRWCKTTSDVCDVSKDLLNNLISGSLAALGVSVLVFVLTPKEVRRARLRVVEPRETGPLLVQIREGSNRYWFDGNSGRYTRGVTLPALAKAARENNATREISILVLDPQDARLCRGYAEYRASLRSASSKQPWTAERVRNESYATILAACCWRHEQTRLDVRVFLRNHFSLFRSDISAKGAVITKEDPQEPGLYSKAGSFFYDAFLEDALLNMRQARELSREPVGMSFDDLTIESVRTFFVALNIGSPSDDDTVKDIIQLARKQENPYAPSIIDRLLSSGSGQ